MAPTKLPPPPKPDNSGAKAAAITGLVIVAGSLVGVALFYGQIKAKFCTDKNVSNSDSRIMNNL